MCRTAGGCNSGKMGVNGLTYYAALPQRTLAATAGMVILIALCWPGTGGGAADLPPIDQCAVRPCG